MVTLPPDLAAPENDYRSLRPVPDAEPAVSVIIPAHGRPEALRRTLAGLLPQLQAKDEVVVVDDGSDPPLGDLPDGVTLLRQERDGFGLVRARNRGAAHTTGEVVVFLDSDTVPGPGYLARHRGWHAAAANLMVVSLRHHVDATAATPEEVATNGPEPLPRVEDPEAAIQPDWRHRFIRRGARLTLGDLAFRAGVGNNLSLRRDRLEQIGPFDGAFKSWGGEDTEFSWRVWNSGAFIVPDDTAVYHQVEEHEQRGWRSRARSLNLSLVADRVPHRFYRPRPHPFATVPKLTWVATAESREEADTVWKRITAVPFGDAELIWVAHGDARDVVSSLEGHTHRVRVVDSVADAVLASTGELICFADARIQFTPGMVPKAVERLDEEPRSSVVRFPYVLGGDRYRRLDDLEALDRTYGRGGAPLFALVRRREVMKDRGALADPERMWAGALERSRLAYLPGDSVIAPLESLGAPRRPGLEEAASTGLQEASRLAVRVARSRLRPTATEPVEAEPAAGVPIDYVGFTERDNLGDDAVLVALQRLMPWARLGRDMGDAVCLMLGGGTLLNANRYYLTRILRRDTPTVERAVFGVGVRDPAFHGETEPMEEWWRFFSSSLYVGVRGPASVEYLRRLGYKGEVEVLGDPALSLPRPDVAVDGDRVVVCPVWTSGNLLGGDDRAVFDALSDLVGRLAAEGRKVTIMSAFPYDDRHILELMRHTGRPDLEYVAGYTDVDLAMRTLAGAGMVVAERLHAAILAAAAGRPFVALEYWPKHRDFARSLGVEELVVATEGVRAEELWRRFRDIDGRRDEIAERLDSEVRRYRHLQGDAAERLRLLLEKEHGEGL